MSCTKLHWSKACCWGCICFLCLCLLCIMLITPACVWNPRIRRVLALVDRLGRPEDSCSGIVLAYTGSSFSAAAALTLRDWGLPARGAAGQRRQRSAVFLARPSARSERRRSVAAEIQLEGCWARGPPTPPSQPKRDFPRRLKQPATSARRSDRGDLNSKSPRRVKRAAARK